MKLKSKIQLFTSLFMLVLILLINTSIYFLFYKLSADSEIEELKAQANTITSALNSSPDIAESELLKAFLPTDGMIRVIPEEGAPLEHSKDKTYFDLPIEYKKNEEQSITRLEGRTYAMISKPIIWNDGDIMTLQVTKHLVNLTENMKVLLYVLVIASFIILVPVIIAGNVLSRFLLQPIKTLIQIMNKNTKDARWEKIDITNRSKDELYELEVTYNSMIDKLKDNYEKQEIFVSDASHELKTPISIVKSYAQLLEKRGLNNPELFKESVETIDSEADRMNKLVEQMLSLAKNKTAQELGDVDLISLCEQAITTFQGAYDREIEFESPRNALVVKGSSDQIQQILYILIDNALKYSNKKIKIELKQDHNMAVFSVRDYGKGIPEKDRQRVFDRFYRVDKARSRDTGGTGLGLAIAKNLAELHHGTLSLESELGKGSKFILRLPNK